MSLQRSLFWLKSIVILTAIASTTYLYFYPVVFGCAFPSTTGLNKDGFKNTIALHRGLLQDFDPSIAPFRLLVLADPQLEGDSSLPDPNDALLAKIYTHQKRLRDTSYQNLTSECIQVTKELFFDDIPRALWTIRKSLDLFGNDYYLAHIYRTLHWWSKPTHVTVLGDLIGSQWVTDDEFEWRSWRYWNRVMAGSQKVEEYLMNWCKQEKEERQAIPLESNTTDWTKQVINIVGNHDIGYAGDISRSRIERFEKEFGSVNWDIHFSYPQHRIPETYAAAGLATPTIHLIVLNSMIFDTPALYESIQGETYNYVNGLISSRLDRVESRDFTFTLLLTHVPLHKSEGICVDAPFFDFWDYDDDAGLFKNGGLKEQNHLSDHSSRSGILQGIFGMSGDVGAPAAGKGRNGLILTGHDHEGCDVVHYIERKTEQVTPPGELGLENSTDPKSSQEEEPQETIKPEASAASTELITSWSWQAVRTPHFPSLLSNTTHVTEEQGPIIEIPTSLREITLRSMMGEYSGNAGLLSVWYDFTNRTWKYEMQLCPLGVQHTWWAIHVIDLIAILALLVEFSSWIYVRSQPKTTSTPSIAIPRDKAANRELTRLQASETKEGHKRSPSQRRRKG